MAADRQGDSDLSGEWIAELEMTGQAAAMAYGWLKDMEAWLRSPISIIL